MKLVDKKNDFAFAGGDFFKESLETILKFATKLGAGDHRADIHRDESFVFEGFRHIAAHNAAGEAFDNGGLAHTRLADEHGVVFGAAGENLHGAADLIVAANDGVDLARAGSGGEVAAVFFQRLVFALGILIGDALAATHGD